MAEPRLLITCFNEETPGFPGGFCWLRVFCPTSVPLSPRPKNAEHRPEQFRPLENPLGVQVVGPGGLRVNPDGLTGGVQVAASRQRNQGNGPAAKVMGREPVLGAVSAELPEDIRHSGTERLRRELRPVLRPPPVGAGVLGVPLPEVRL